MLSADFARLESITPVLPAGDVFPLLNSLELLLLPSGTASWSKGFTVSPVLIVTESVVILSVDVLLPQDAMAKLIAAIINVCFMMLFL